MERTTYLKAAQLLLNKQHLPSACNSLPLLVSALFAYKKRIDILTFSNLVQQP